MSSRTPRVGDLFTIRGRRLVGRVISTTAIVGPTHGCILVYVYADARLSRDALAAAPLLTTRAPWSHGLFEWLRNEPLLPGQALDRHVFRDGLGDWFDDQGRPAAPSPAVAGEYHLFEVEAIEQILSGVVAEYDTPPPGPPPAGDVSGPVREVWARWVSSFGRPPTRDEWLALYDVALGADEEARGRS